MLRRARKPAWTGTVPNPKTGEEVEVRAFWDRHGYRQPRLSKLGVGKGPSEWYLTAHAPSVLDVSVATTELDHAGGPYTWAWLSTPVARLSGAAYGLCLYMGAALFAHEALGCDGIAAGTILSGSAFTLWEKMYQHGLATCSEAPSVAPPDDDDHEYVARCWLPAARVQDWIARYRRGR